MFPPLYEIRKANTRQFTTFDPATKSKTVRIMPGEPPRTIVKSDKPGIISRMWLTFPGWFWRHWDTQAENDTSTLKKLIIIGTASLNRPLNVRSATSLASAIANSDTSSHGISECRAEVSIPTSRCHIKQVRIELENLHERIPLDVFFNANYEEYAELPNDSGRFHCLFRTARLGGKDPLPLVDIQGRGHYIGCCLSMQGEDLNYLSYLEAPEYMYIDTEERDHPTIVGTGLEDYFNGGWYFRNGEFYAELHGVPLKDTLRSMISMYRFHERDAVAFEKNLSISFVNPWESKYLKPYWYSSTAYWYQDQATSLPDKLPVDKLMSMYRRRDTDHQSYP